MTDLATKIATKQVERAAAPTIEGHLPDRDDLPAGCRFAARCGERLPACEAAHPPLAPVGPAPIDGRTRCPVRLAALVAGADR